MARRCRRPIREGEEEPEPDGLPGYDWNGFFVPLGEACDCCPARTQEVRRYHVTAPGTIAFDKTLCPQCAVKGMAAGWTVTDITVRQ